MNCFYFQAVIPALHRLIVVAVALRAHAADKAVVREQLSILARAILAATVRVDDDTTRAMPTEQRHAQSIASQRRGHAIGHRPAYDDPRVQIHHHCHVQPALVGGNVRDVADPFLVRALGAEVLL